MTLITSGETFTRLTGVKDYSLVMIQINTDAQEEDIQAIRSAVGENYVFMTGGTRVPQGHIRHLFSACMVFL